MPKPERAGNNTSTIYSDFSRRQKTAIVFVAVLSLAVVVVWLLQINSQIRRPFQSPNKEAESAIAELDLSLTDSDSDSLSDYDELNVYKTSPYLEDTDSDGISDYEEISQGTDPNCPMGQNCYSSESFSNQDSQAASSSSELLGEDLISDLPSTTPTSSGTIINPEDVTPEILRQVLLESGYEAEVLKEISDEDLMASYQEALQLGSGGGTAE